MTPGALIRFSRVSEILRHSYPILVVMGMVAARPPLNLLTLWAVLTNLVIFVFIHMVNDLEDGDDDARHPGKAKRNPVASGDLSSRTAARVAAATGGLGLAMLIPFPLAAAAVGLSLIGLGFLYSWRPVRFKSLPVIDLLIHGYILAAGQVWFFALLDGAAIDRYTVLIAAGVFVFSMGGDLYNELRDWDADRDAGLRNTAGLVGRGRAWRLMIGCYAAGFLSAVGGCLYLVDRLGSALS